MQIDVRQMGADQAEEWYIHATPTANLPAAEQAAEVYAALADVLRQKGGCVVEERVFALPAKMGDVTAARAAALRGLVDDVPPTLLGVPAGYLGEYSGTFLHLVTGLEARTIDLGDGACGRAMATAEGTYVTLAGITAPDAGDDCTQSRVMFEKAEKALQAVGGDFHNVVRTWWWLGDILDWYGPFNEVRNEFFRERGLLDDGSGKRDLPASTGIGIGPALGGACAVDVVALLREGETPELLLAGGDQNPAYDYGSAFSRASRCATPAGDTVFISGTAAIDADGNTEFLDMVPEQVEATIRHVRAVLKDTGCTDEDVVNALIYCKTPEVEKHFVEVWKDQLPWPTLVFVCDVCRDDLLFEIEAAAMPGAKKVR